MPQRNLVNVPTKNRSGSEVGLHAPARGAAFARTAFSSFANARIQNWRIDGDGMLRVTACVLKEGVYPYGAHEVGAEAAGFFAGIDPVMEYIPASEFTDEALASLEGKPVVVGAHEWRDAENTLVDGFTVGTIAGQPRVDDMGSLLCDMLIFDSETIQQITDRKLVEVSAGYDGTILPGEGTFKGHAYHGTQQHLRFNHVLLLPAGGGRCGRDVRIINRGTAKSGTPAYPATQTNAQSVQGRALGTASTGATSKGDTMSQAKTVSLATGNGVFNFTNEEDAKTADLMQQRQQEVVNEEKADRQAEKEQMEARIAALEMEIQRCQEQLAKKDEELEQFKLAGQEEDERAIIEAENEKLPEAEQVDFDEFAEKELGNCKNLAERRKATIRKMNAMRGIATVHDDSGYTAVFINQAASAKKAANNRRDNAHAMHSRNSNSRSVRRSEEPCASRPMSSRDHILRCMSSNVRVKINP